ncbi:HIRA-interacting protein 3 isoform X2 [Pituophis catenifer annectens]|uniref:HIRA-interacting protein 3 isoform X2 n=1 Tax=Pituophis catenifer annectens TaxID=94852 RepID=UPI003991A23C
MVGGGAGQQRKMQDFVSRLFQGSPDLSILTHAIVRKKYLDHVGLENLSKQEKEQLKQLVEEELVQMKVLVLGGEKTYMLCLEVSSDEKDSGIDSKKRPHHGNPKLLRMFSDSSDQGETRAGNHSDESESDEETIKSKRKPSLQEARRERRRGRKSPKSQRIRGSQKRGVSESEETNMGQSDLEEVKEHRKVTKGNSLKQRDFKKKADKKSKANDPKGKAKNRTMNKQREERNLSEGGTDLLEVEEISEKKSEWSESEEKKSFSTNKSQERMGPGTQKDSKGNESEDASGSGPDKIFYLQKKMADTQCRRKCRVIEDSGSSSEDSAGQSPMRKEGAKRARGERGSQQTGNHSKPKRQPKKRGGRKKLQREDLCRKKPEEVKKMMQGIQESTSEESESESEEHKSLEEEKKWVQDPTSSEGESQSKTNQGQLRKAALISHPSKSESDESEDGDPRRTLKKESKHVSGCDSSQGEKSQRKNIGKEISVLGSEDLGSEFGGKKKIQSQQQRTKKLQRRSATKEKRGEESSQEEGSTSEEDEPTTSQQHHLGKDKKHHSGKKEEHPSIQRLKRYIRECGVRQNYKKLLAGCHSRKAQIEVLKEELGSLGIKGTPSLAKCKALKQKREEAAEVASLDINNIIATEGRPKRRKVWSLYNKPQESPSSPEDPTVRSHTTDWSQLQGVISSDRESG